MNYQFFFLQPCHIFRCSTPRIINFRCPIANFTFTSYFIFQDNLNRKKHTYKTFIYKLFGLLNSLLYCRSNIHRVSQVLLTPSQDMALSRFVVYVYMQSNIRLPYFMIESVSWNKKKVTNGSFLTLDELLLMVRRYREFVSIVVSNLTHS